MFGISQLDKVKITLPSNGHIDGIPKEVYISPLTGKHEIKLNTVSMQSYVDYIINECVTTEEGGSVATDKLLPADKTYIMFMIRSITYSDEFTSEYICRNPECGRLVNPVVKLSELEVTRLTEDPTNDLQGIDLGDNITINLKLLTDSELNRLEFEAKQMSNRLRNEKSADEYYNLLYLMRSIESFSYVNKEGQLVEVDGNDPSERPTLQAFVEVLPARGISKIRNSLGKANEFGVSVGTYHKCENCDTVNIAPVSLVATEFFRPSNT